MGYYRQYVVGLNGHKYPIIRGLNYYCVPTCLQMVCASMGVYVNNDDISRNFKIQTSSDTDDKNKYGICLNNGDLNNLFYKLGIPLTEKYTPISHVPDFEFVDIIQQVLNNGAHIICGYSYGMLYNKEDLYSIGHASIVIDADDRNVTIIDPGPSYHGVKIVKEDSLYNAIRRKQDGLWVLIPTM